MREARRSHKICAAGDGRMGQTASFIFTLHQHILPLDLQLNTSWNQQRPSGLIRSCFLQTGLAVRVGHLLTVYRFEVITRPADARKTIKNIKCLDKDINFDCETKEITLCNRGLVFLSVAPQWTSKAKPARKFLQEVCSPAALDSLREIKST